MLFNNALNDQLLLNSSCNCKTNNHKNCKTTENNNLLESDAVEININNQNKILNLHENEQEADIINIDSKKNCCHHNSNNQNNQNDETLIMFQTVR